MTLSHTGSTAEFDASWKTRRESRYNHYTAGAPQNQIQLAFRSHWQLFQELLGDRTPGSCLEVGSGRGSISSYFAQAGWKCVLLDYSEEVLRVARDIFHANGHNAAYVQGDARALPVENETVDVVVSIGLLEHFEDIRTVLTEQVRVLSPGGLLLVYVVPQRPDNIQRYFRWLNALLKSAAALRTSSKATQPKAELYRSDDGSARYLEVLRSMPLQDLTAFGVYPLPMISHSPEFPFSLMPWPAERALTGVYRAVLRVRRWLYRRNPWICAEQLGQAFLVVGRKHAHAAASERVDD